MIHAYRILVIIGSVRERRICPQIAEWVAQCARDIPAFDVEVIDLRDWPLPMGDEACIPALGEYAHEHTLAWSRKVAGADGFVIVTPQYNWGYPAPLKNALDHLYDEWCGKPAMIVSYGGHGGGKCARQLRQVLKGLKMKPLRRPVGLTLSHESIVANTGIIDPEVAFAKHATALRRAFAALAARLT